MNGAELEMIFKVPVTGSFPEAAGAFKDALGGFRVSSAIP